jgi:hypothetical protein
MIAGGRRLGRTMKPVPLALAALLVAGCSGGTPAARVAPTSTPASSTPAPTCPKTQAPAFSWPAEFPRDLPKPPAAAFKQVQRQGGVTSVRFSTTTSLRESLLFTLGAIPRAGFTIGRGDAEPAEADVPFGRGDLRGIYKMIVLGRCSTDWLVAVARISPTGGSPILPTPKPGPSSSPLPFG